MFDPVTLVLVGGGLFSIGAIGQETGCGPGCAQLPGVTASFPHTPCPSAAYPAAAPLQGAGQQQAGGYTYYAGFAPTPAYTIGSQFYGYSVGYTPVAPVPAFTSSYAGASKYYYE